MLVKYLRALLSRFVTRGTSVGDETIYGRRITEVGVPDWNNAISLSDAQENLDYTAVKDGVVISYGANSPYAVPLITTAIVLRNAVGTTTCSRSSNGDSSVWCSVKKGETANVFTDGVKKRRFFVPYK